MTTFYLTLSSLILLWAIWSGSWKVLFKSTVIYSVLGGIVALGFAWNMKAVMNGMAAEALVGLSFQFFGASLLVAMYGLRPAVVMLAIVTLIVSLVSGWSLDYALRQYLVLGVLPAFVACGVMRLICGCLPKHLFIFILGHGYVSGVISVIVPAILLFSLNQLTVTQQMGLSMDMVDWFITLVILSFTEGSISGMLLAVFVIYKPEWVPRFSDQEYLKSSEA
jgi:uncharacterized membrane protein